VRFTRFDPVPAARARNPSYGVNDDRSATERARQRPGRNPFYTRAEIAAALETTVANGFGGNHSLCHGDLGNMDLSDRFGETMKDSAQRIFRAEALQRYLQGRQAPVWPRLVAPPVFACTWILATLFLMAGLSAWLCKVPVYVSGAASVVQCPDGERLIVAFFAPAHLPRLRAGQRLVLSSDDGRSRFTELIVAVKSEIISPGAAQQQCALGAAHVITGPSAVATAHRCRRRIGAVRRSAPAPGPRPGSGR
jgi:hypothetical protein